MNFFDKIMEQLNPAPNPDIEPAFSYQNQHVPTLWLLGKTGAGKSSLIQAVTGNSRVEIGNGFKPCTLSSASYRFPEDKPVLRFLDTRGLAEADYQPEEDIAACKQASHGLVVVMKAEEPAQAEVLQALARIRKSGGINELLLVHTGVAQLSDADRKQCVCHHRSRIEAVWKKTFASVEVDFELDDGSQLGMDELVHELAKLLPIIARIVDTGEHKTREEENFSRLKTEILWYAGAAATSDVIPAVGLVSVPSIQGKMLHSLGNQYSVEWNRQTFTEFVGMLGAGFGIQYAGKLGIRQLVKLIPIYGQVVGAASAAAMSFSSTYAIGRAACMYLYHKSKGEEISGEAIKAQYEEALKRGREAASNETGH